MAAEILANAGCNVTIYDRMPSLGRKFLMAGRGGLNLTHSENLENFISRYGENASWLAPYIHSFPPSSLRAWCEGLGQETFIGSSGRIFPKSMKAAPLLRAWLLRLDKLGVHYIPRHNWQGWENDALKFTNAANEKILVNFDASLLALGGASWPRLGANGNWVEILKECGVPIAPLQPANCGFIANWSPYFGGRFAGMPLKSVAITYKNITQQGDAMTTAQGIEGGAIYAISSHLRQSITNHNTAHIKLDLRPGMSVQALAQKLKTRSNTQSLSTYLRKAGFSALDTALLHEVIPKEILAAATPIVLATHLKALPLTFTATAGLARAISTAGGIQQTALNADLMLYAKPGVFAAGEMLDWEAPTGGYLLQACFSTAVAAANGMLKFCIERPVPIKRSMDGISMAGLPRSLL